MEYNTLLIKYGEIAIRGKNRKLFEDKLISIIRKAVGRNYRVKREQGRFLVEENLNQDGESSCYDSMNALIPRICKISGIHSVCPAIKIEYDHKNTTDSKVLSETLDIIKKYASNHFYENHIETAGIDGLSNENNISQLNDQNKISFKVETKRADKMFPITSTEISALVGGYILNKFDNITVDVHNPDVLLNIELRTFCYIYSKEYKGYGGLPVSSSGRGLFLLSGGIDSPVASFLLSKRGVYGEFIYFHSPPYITSKAKQKVIDLANTLSQYCGETKLHIVNFTEIQQYLHENVPEDKLTIFLKRAMLKIASIVAEKNNMLVLATGDSIGQVASQTIFAINSIDSASDIPVLRPLSGLNKSEIISIARKLGTYEISIQPYEDCCTLFVATHPETKPKRSVIEAIERNLFRLDSLIIGAIGDIEEVRVDYYSDWGY